jgi:hypothetical protein
MERQKHFSHARSPKLARVTEKTEGLKKRYYLSFFSANSVTL